MANGACGKMSSLSKGLPEFITLPLSRFSGEYQRESMAVVFLSCGLPGVW